MGVWIAIAIVLFVLGSIMALKPGAVDMRLDKLRMTARRLELNPKVVACPDWIRGKDNEYGRGMMGQYALILDDYKFPETQYIVIDGELRPYTQKANDKLSKDTQPTPDYTLDHEPINLPDSILSLAKGTYSKGNSLVFFWDDSGYAKPNSNPDYDVNKIEPELAQLKQQMMLWANKLAK